MFGFGKIHQEKIIETTFADSARTLGVQISEFVRLADIDNRDINAFEHVSFVCWVYYVAYQNCDLSAREIERCASSLARASMSYLLQKFNSGEMKSQIEVRQSQLVLEEMTTTFRQYDDAFNAGKARSFDMSVGEDQLLQPLLDTFVQRSSITSSASDKLHRQGYGIKAVLNQSLINTMKLINQS